MVVLIRSNKKWCEDGRGLTGLVLYHSCPSNPKEYVTPHPNRLSVGYSCLISLQDTANAVDMMLIGTMVGSGQKQGHRAPFHFNAAFCSAGDLAVLVPPCDRAPLREKDSSLRSDGLFDNLLRSRWHTAPIDRDRDLLWRAP